MLQMGRCVHMSAYIWAVIVEKLSITSCIALLCRQMMDLDIQCLTA